MDRKKINLQTKCELDLVKTDLWLMLAVIYTPEAKYFGKGMFSVRF